VPLSLRVWWEEVGAVDLTGSHPDWPTGWPGALTDVLAQDALHRVHNDAAGLEAVSIVLRSVIRLPKKAVDDASAPPGPPAWVPR
jgi:hypothetical protein